ncbi:Rrf2 family transcriptional regulator [Acidiferrobacter sp. SPIII_3]|uniref:Rrf2 family transcriptional regulator n=1 Tax=Acidiferrobacter sp. SPIII_3 TaxID=1281578 RepID=UPI000D7323A8|nr:Rrf2 family transcriptional regulator [Acidiferrobacter sp. SPIII_3]AWP24511.1 Rrf2 family transcriptional regulator [Acidiferrobacter sp. SPIII_3]
MAVLGKGVEYALHCLLYLSNPPDTHSLAVGDIARFQGVSETYLAKVFTKLKKAGLVRSALGAKGGYELAKPPEQITFWDVAVAVEGEVRLFECWNIREKSALYRGKPRPDWARRGPCTIHQVMMEAEAQIKAALAAKTLAWLARDVDRKVPKHQEQAARWFREITSPES